ncbi:MAG: hypothetical protein J7M19_06755 [Planctomycetes bacterium]|nr:hypothetical protein [Planctomycetota bacterium]
MEISIDGRAREVEEIPDTIGKLIKNLKNAVGQANRVVLSVSLDGQRMDADGERRIADRPPGEFSCVAVETADAKVLCLATLEEAAKHIEPVIDEASRIGDLIDTGKGDEALRRIVPCLEVWSTIISAVEKVGILLELDFERVITDETTLNGAIEELAEFLRSLKTSVDTHDFVAIRDQMKHEMPEIGARISSQLAALSSVITAK